MRKRTRFATSTALVGLLISCAGAAAAQSQSAPVAASPAGEDAAAPQAPSQAGLDDIVVTAQKRSTSLQRTPLAVTALSAQTVTEAQIRNLEDITGRVPSLKISDSQGYPQITIRGIGINNFVQLAESAVALNVNESYVSRPISFLAGLYDVSDLEVLRGPQGTLYGRNATAGAVNLTTTRPTDVVSGYGNISYGNYNDVRLEGAVGGPIAGDTLMARVAGFRETRDGFGTNLTTGRGIDDRNAYGVRGTLLFNPAANLKITLIGEYSHEDDNGGSNHYVGVAAGGPTIAQILGAKVPASRRDIANVLDPLFRLKVGSVTGIIDWDVAGPFSFKSITSYRHVNSLNRADLSGGDPGTYYVSGEPDSTFSQEIQAHYDRDGVHVVAGGFYFHENDNGFPAILLSNNIALDFLHYQGGAFPVPGYSYAEAGGRQIDDAYAVFGEATINVTSRLSLTAGARYSSERKQLDNRFNGTEMPYTGNFIADPNTAATTSFPARTFNSFTPRLGIQYQADPNTFLYFTYSKGFKAGGFSLASADFAAGQGFRPEKLTDYEGGVKTTLFDRHLRLNLAGFYYQYTDLQVQIVNNGTLQTTNAGSAKIYGAEAEVTANLTPAFTIDGNATWLHARYGQYVGLDDSGFTTVVAPPFGIADFTGHRLDNAPDFQAFAGLSYQVPVPHGNLKLRGEVEYSSRFYFTAINIDIMSQPSFAKGNVFLTYTNDAGWHVRAFARNVTDKTTYGAMHASGGPFLGSLINGSLTAPRTYGLEVGYAF